MKLKQQSGTEKLLISKQKALRFNATKILSEVLENSSSFLLVGKPGS